MGDHGRDGSSFDSLARDLASGEISRRTALGRLLGGAAAATVASIPGASALASGSSKRCPKSRRCGDKCCPKHASCKHGKCKCDAGFTKCGKKCFDLQTSVGHCGDCDAACGPGEACIGGQCVACSAAVDCSPDGQCGVAACNSGQCEYTPNPLLGGACNGPQGEAGVIVCEEGQLTCSYTPATCGDDIKNGAEDCDGSDLGGQTCASLGFASGTLACSPDCTFNTQGCTPVECDGPEDGPAAALGSCQQAACSGGTCGFAADNTNVPNDSNQCTTDACNQGTPTFTPVGTGTVCNQNGGTVCDGSGNCVQCNLAGDCPGTDTVCQTKTCQGNVCGTTFAGQGTQCSAATCSNGLLTPASTCNGSGTCQGAGSPVSCSPYKCAAGGTACSTSCASGADCVAGYTCSASVCKKAQGQTCTGGGECASGYCVDGVCCQSACNGTCEKCSQPGRAGFCDPIPNGQDPDGECPNGVGLTGFCNGARACGTS